MAFTLSISKILEDLRPGESYSVAGDQFSYANLNWLDAATKPTEAEMTTAELTAAKNWRTAQIKIEAGERILAAVPQWRQNNMGADKYDGTTTPTLASLNTLIDDIRTASDTAETDVDALSTVQAVIDFTW